jgi:hypothetical protein
MRCSSEKNTSMVYTSTELTKLKVFIEQTGVLKEKYKEAQEENVAEHFCLFVHTIFGLHKHNYICKKISFNRLLPRTYFLHGNFA